MNNTSNQVYPLDLTEVRPEHLLYVVLSIIIISGCFYIILASEKHWPPLFKVSLIIICVIFIVGISLILVSRALTLSLPTFDMGIFTQMYENIVQGNGPVTTIERDGLLSHFKVHVSPILYVLAPIYALVRRPETLIVLQIIVTFSGIIPFYLLLKEFDFHSRLRQLLLLFFIVVPAFTTGHLYDFHENSFLVPLIFWVIYASIKQQPLWILISTILLLFVKEDAMIYVISIGGYFLLQERFPIQRRLLNISIHLILPVAYFIACLWWLRHYGDGAMTSRFQNFMLPGQDSLIDVVINAFSNPLYTINSLMTQSKMIYIFTMLVSFSFIPLFQKHWAHYILFVPMIVINLISNYPYQVDIGKQYSYGSYALVLFAMLLALESLLALNISRRVIHYGVVVAIGASIGVVMTFYMPRHHYFVNYTENYEKLNDIRHVLREEISVEGKSVLTFTRYSSDLARANVLYDLFYHNKREYDPTIDLVIFPRSLYDQNKAESDVIQLYISHGYIESMIEHPEVVVLERGEVE